MMPYSYTFKSDENYKSYEAERKWKQIMFFSAVLTIFISCIGLFGLSVLSAERRIKRDRHSKSSGRFGKQRGDHPVKGLCATGDAGFTHRDTPRMVCN